MGHIPGNAPSVEGLQRKLGPFTFLGGNACDGIQRSERGVIQDSFIEFTTTFVEEARMAQPTLHVVFTPSGAGTLRQTLKTARRDDQVISFFDDLRFGPINPPDPTLRARWVEDELGWTDWTDATQSDVFWSKALSSDARKIAWLSRRSTMEYAGFLEWLWRLGDGPCEIVDITELKVSRRPEHGPPRPPTIAVSVAGLFPNEILENKIFDQHKSLQPEARAEYHDLWHKLRSENAPLRVLASNQLVSAPISYFDSLLMSCVTNEWRKVARVVGTALASQMDDYIYQVGDIFLAGRVNAMAENGQLEIQGASALEMRFSEVRLPHIK